MSKQGDTTKALQDISGAGAEEIYAGLRDMSKAVQERQNAILVSRPTIGAPEPLAFKDASVTTASRSLNVGERPKPVASPPNIAPLVDIYILVDGFPTQCQFQANLP